MEIAGWDFPFLSPEKCARAFSQGSSPPQVHNEPQPFPPESLLKAERRGKKSVSSQERMQEQPKTQKRQREKLVVDW